MPLPLAEAGGFGNGFGVKMDNFEEFHEEVAATCEALFWNKDEIPEGVEIGVAESILWNKGLNSFGDGTSKFDSWVNDLVKTLVTTEIHKIGTEINKYGGFTLMRTVHDYTRLMYGAEIAHQIDIGWDGINSWSV